jgi:hypothetical protein
VDLMLCQSLAGLSDNVRAFQATSLARESSEKPLRARLPQAFHRSRRAGLLIEQLSTTSCFAGFVGWGMDSVQNVTPFTKNRESSDLARRRSDLFARLPRAAKRGAVESDRLPRDRNDVERGRASGERRFEIR